MHAYYPNDSWGLEGPSNHSAAREDGITPLPKNRGDAIPDANIPPVLAGMDKAEALAYVSRLFDPAQAGAVLWGDKLLLKRYLAQCSRTGSAETQAGYHRELRHFTRWRDQHHPHLHLRELDPALVDDLVSSLREQVAAGLRKPRTYNRRVAAISSLYRWASEPARSAVTGIPRNPMPRHLCGPEAGQADVGGRSRHGAGHHRQSCRHQHHRTP